jgi:hypothetical protein
MHAVPVLHGDPCLARRTAVSRQRDELGRGSIVAMALSLLGMDSSGQSDSGFVELLDDGLSQWQIEHSVGANFVVADSVLRVGGPEGWLRGEAQYGDFALIVEFRFLTDAADSGVFFRAAGVEPFARGWPNRSYQLQMLNPLAQSRFPPLGGLFRHGMPPGETHFDETLARRMTAPTGQWQTLAIEVRGEHVVADVNGVRVLDADGIGNARGFIGLQGETDAVEFRSVRIRELD